MCFLSMLAATLLMAIISLANEHRRISLSHLVQRPMAVSAGIVFIIFFKYRCFGFSHLKAQRRC